MNIKKSLLREHSKINTMRLVKFIGTSQPRFDALMKIYFGPNQKLAQRAAWVVSHSGTQHPELIKKHVKKMIRNLHNQVHDAVKRAAVRTISEIEIAKTMQARVYDTCIGLLANKNEAVAIRVCAMIICVNITLSQPELKRETWLVIEEQMPYASAGMRARAKCEFKRLSKLPH
jgi:hypothetical protein